MTGFAEDTLSRDAYLGGRMHLWQPRRGYRAGIDPMLLAAAVPARAGQSVLDLGCGVGAAVLALAARVPGLNLAGVERQPDYAALARRNGAEAGLEVVTADLTELPASLRARRFDHVIANPPYFDPSGATGASDPGRRAAQQEETALAEWIAVAARRLLPRGYLHMIHRAERLPDMLAAAQGRLGSLECLPITGRIGRPAHLVLLRARKQGRAAFCLHPPLILHHGPRHEADRESYVPEIQAVLREGAALSWPG